MRVIGIFLTSWLLNWGNWVYAGPVQVPTLRVPTLTFVCIASHIKNGEFKLAGEKLKPSRGGPDDWADDGVIEKASNTRAERIEGKNQSTPGQGAEPKVGEPVVDRFFKALNEAFPDPTMNVDRNPPAPPGFRNGTLTDYFPPIKSKGYLDLKTGELVPANATGKRIVEQNPERYVELSLGIKGRLRKYVHRKINDPNVVHVSPVSATRTKLELKMKSLVPGKVFKPSCEFEDADLRLLFDPDAWDANVPMKAYENFVRHRHEVAARAKAFTKKNGEPLNDPDEVDQLMNAYDAIMKNWAMQQRAFPKSQRQPFRSVVSTLYNRDTRQILVPERNLSDGTKIEKYDIQFTADTQGRIYRGQILPLIFGQKPSTETLAAFPDGHIVMEDKVPEAFSGYDPQTRRIDPSKQVEIWRQQLHLQVIDSLLAIVRGARNPEIEAGTGKFGAWSQGAYPVPENEQRPFELRSPIR